MLTQMVLAGVNPVYPVRRAWSLCNHADCDFDFHSCQHISRSDSRVRVDSRSRHVIDWLVSFFNSRQYVHSNAHINELLNVRTWDPSEGYCLTQTPGYRVDFLLQQYYCDPRRQFQSGTCLLLSFCGVLFCLIRQGTHKNERKD